MGLLQQSDEFQPVELFERLEDFYFRWCDGEFIDADGTTFPQTKMRELKEQIPQRDTYLGQRQVDVYAGLNIMILLLELHRYGQDQENETKDTLAFYPCSKLDARGKLEDSKLLLLRLINYSDCIGIRGFSKTVGSFLRGAFLEGSNLQGASLQYASLQGSNLQYTSLQGSDLKGAFLQGSNLQSASLQYASLQGADLQRASLQGTYLRSAYLRSADLQGADLQGADLQGAYLQGTNLEGAKFGNNEGISEPLKQELIERGAIFEDF